MKFFTPHPLVLLFFICCIPCLTCCSKDSDLFNEYVLLNPEETLPLEDTSSDESDGSNEEEASNEEDTSDAKEGDGINLLLNGTFENSDEWELLNGSTATGGILRIITSGRIQSSRSNWSASYHDISLDLFFISRRYRLTFEARRVSGQDVLRAGLRNLSFFDDALTTDFQTYVVEFNGEGRPGGNDLVFGGDGNGDVFEIKNVILEDIGVRTSEDGSTIDPNTGLPTAVSFYTDFETDDQWGGNGEEPPAGVWEVDHGAPRTTDHPDSPLKSGRNGGRAIWLGSYNNDIFRNELGSNNALSFREHWMSFSLYVENKLPSDRIIIQNRPRTGSNSNRVNTLSLRQGGDEGKENQLYFSLATDVNSVDTLPQNGAGSNTESVYFDYNQGEWIDIVIHQKCAFGKNYNGPDTSELARAWGFDPKSDGYIEIWVNGEKIIDHVGTTTYRYSKHGQETEGIITPKIGPYWARVNEPTGDLYFDNYKIWTGPGGTYQDLDPSN